MKIKKHMIEVEIPTEECCKGCEFVLFDGATAWCRLIDTELDWHFDQNGCGVLRCDDCIEKFGLEKS